MRKHNRKFATSFGSANVDAATPQMSHNIVKSKWFQLAANNLLGRMLLKVVA